MDKSLAERLISGKEGCVGVLVAQALKSDLDVLDMV